MDILEIGYEDKKKMELKTDLIVGSVATVLLTSLINITQ
jgi:hypothetical protein